MTRRLEGFGTTIFTEMTRLADRARRHQPRAGLSGLRRAGVRQGRGDRGDPRGARPVRADERASPRSTTRSPRSTGATTGSTTRADTEITVTSGATEAIFAAIQGICDAGRRGRPLRAVLRLLQGERRDGGRRAARSSRSTRPDWRFDPAELARGRSRERTRAILVNTPHNPTGKVFSREELEAIARLCREHDVVCITDEVYEHLVYEGEHVPMATLPGMRERTITISSFGKTFSLTGWKIGWAAAPPDAHRRPCARRTSSSPSRRRRRSSTRAAARARGGPGVLRDARSRTIARRRDYLVARARRGSGSACGRPPGTYFVCADFRPFGFERRRRLLPAPDRGGRRRRDPAERLLRPTASTARRTCASPSARRWRRSRPRWSAGRSPGREAVRIA